MLRTLLYLSRNMASTDDIKKMNKPDVVDLAEKQQKIIADHLVTIADHEATINRQQQEVLQIPVLKQQITDHEATIQTQAQTIADSHTEITNLKDTVKNHETTIQTHTQTIDDFQKDVAALNKKIKDQVDTIDSKQQEVLQIPTLKQKIVGHEATIKKLTQSETDSLKEITDLKTTVANQKDEISSSAQKLADTQTLLKDKTTEADGNMKQVLKLQQKKAEDDATIQGQAREITESKAEILKLKAKIEEQSNQITNSAQDLVNVQALLEEKSSLVEGYQNMIQQNSSIGDWGDSTYHDQKVLLIGDDRSRAMVEEHIKHEAKWDSVEEICSVADLTGKIKTSGFMETVEAYDKVVFFMGYEDIKKGENGQRVFASLKQIALRVLEAGTDVAITVQPPVNEVNKNCHLMILNRLLESISPESGIQIISIDYFKETPMYQILDMDGNITDQTAKKVAIEIANKVEIRAVEKKVKSEEKVKPEGKENKPPISQPGHNEVIPKNVPKMTLDECVPLPLCYVGRVIGKKGSSIREMQDLTGAKINIQYVDITGVPEKAAVFSGTPTQVRLARKRVLDVLVEIEKRDQAGSQGADNAPTSSAQNTGMGPGAKIKKIR